MTLTTLPSAFNPPLELKEMKKEGRGDSVLISTAALFWILVHLVIRPRARSTESALLGDGIATRRLRRGWLRRSKTPCRAIQVS